ncbi:hypothetical protein CBM2588_A160033 [Cupriavidus taiwanensis]|nr:hypothetical protein CBM2588_A160033 [Cupriavidus taiwanensis]
MRGLPKPHEDYQRSARRLAGTRSDALNQLLKLQADLNTRAVTEFFPVAMHFLPRLSNCARHL